MIWLCMNIGVLRSVLSEVTKRGDFSHGSHWNIFLIISFIMLISVIIPNFLIKHVYFIAIGVTILYQLALSSGLEDFLLDYQRQQGFLEHNLVGICQTFGFLACYLTGLGFGRKLFETGLGRSEHTNEDKTILYELLKLLIGSLVIFLIGYFVFEHTAPRVTNMAYIGYMGIVSAFSALIVFIPDRITVKTGPNIILDGPGRSSRLIYFMVANILTGIVNFLWITEKLPEVAQHTVMIMYALILHGAFALLVKSKVNVRFW